MMIRRTLPLAIVAAAALTLSIAAPAVAHPYIHGSEIPVDSLATVTLDLAHGCDTEEEGAGERTTEVALEVPDWLRIVEVPEPDGWTVELEVAEDDTVVEVVSWTTDDPREPAPTFDLDVVASGEVGDERHLGVFQACGDASYRWVGTPDEPADDPAVGVTLTEPDPDSPPPPEPELEAQLEADEDEAAEEDEAEEPADEPTEDEAAVQDELTDAAEDDDEVAADPVAEADDAGGLPWAIVLVVLAVVAAVGAVVARAHRRRTAAGQG